MALTASSILHDWSARYGAIPVKGGKPVHTRNTSGAILDQRGVLYRPIINTPRFGWDTLYGDSDSPTVLGKRRQTMLSEMARTNSILHSSDLSNAVWAKTSATITTGIADPAGGTSASTMTATAASALADQSLSAGSSIVRYNSVWLRRRTGTGNIGIRIPDASAHTTVTLTAKWQRFSVTSAASTARNHGLLISTSGDAIDMSLAQQDDAAFKTSEIATTTAAATRATDSFYWDFPHAPQGMMVYCRFKELGTLVADGMVWQIGAAGGTNPFISVAENTNYYSVAHHNGTANRTVTLAAAPALDDVVELLAILFADGSVQLIQSLNGAAVSSTSVSATNTLATAWSALRLWLNSNGTSQHGAAGFAELKAVIYADVVATTAQGRIDELRKFELGPDGEVLS